MINRCRVISRRYRVKAIVITGGPCSGKTTTIGKLRERFAEQAVFVPEAATMLLSGGFPMPGKDLVMCPKWRDAFQAAVATVQLNMEDMYQRVARERGVRLMICDRGLLDGAAYMPGIDFPFRYIPSSTNAKCGPFPILGQYALDEKKILARYDRIIHLESLATASPDEYGKTNNEHRMEDRSWARALEYRTRAAWEKHPRHLILKRKDYDGYDAIFEKVASEVQAILS